MTDLQPAIDALDELGKMMTQRDLREMQLEQIAAVKAGGVYRIRSDSELQEFGWLPRVDPRSPEYVKLKQAPCTQRLKGDTGTMKFSALWQKEIEKHNTAAAFKYVIRRSSGYVNQQLWPATQQVVFSTDKQTGWNRLEVLRIENGNAVIKTMNLRPAPYWWEEPTLCNRFTVIDITGNVFYSDPPGVINLPLVSRVNRPLTIPLYKLAEL